MVSITSSMLFWGRLGCFLFEFQISSWNISFSDRIVCRQLTWAVNAPIWEYLWRAEPHRMPLKLLAPWDEPFSCDFGNLILFRMNRLLVVSCGAESRRKVEEITIGECFLAEGTRVWSQSSVQDEMILEWNEGCY